MPGVLVLCETREGKLRAAGLSAIAFGRKAADTRGEPLWLLLCGAGLSEAAAEAARHGAAEVLVADDARLDPYLAETWAPLCARVARERKASVVGATATALGKDLLPRVAALLDCGMAADVAAVTGPSRFRRPIVAGNALVEVEVATDPMVVSARQAEFAAAQPGAGQSPIASVEAGNVDALGAARVSLEETRSERPELTEARIVVSGGRGMRSAENFKVLEALCDTLGAALGASRAAADAGYVPNDLQVGQTGKVVAPDLYVAVAISGAIQHLAGMKGSRVIVAINKDPDAPIFQVADYGLVAKWEDAVPALTEAIRKLKAASA